jgi:hypothetical protein
MTVRSNGDQMSVAIADPPPGSTIALYRPDHGWTYTPIGGDTE